MIRDFERTLTATSPMAAKLTAREDASRAWLHPDGAISADTLGQGHLLCASLDHRRAPLPVREIAANPEIAWSQILAEFLPATCAWFVLSTCNRFEIYLHTDVNPPAATVQALISALSQAFNDVGSHAGFLNGQLDPRPNALTEYFNWYHDLAAAHHLCRVSAGMESRVFGESEILGQITRAYETHVRHGALNPALDTIVCGAIRSGKRIRHETAIGANAGSIGALAIQTVQAQGYDWRRTTIGVVGLGEMGRLVARGVAARKPQRLLLANRTLARAQTLAQEMAADALEWDQLSDLFRSADVIVCATASPNAVITPECLRPIVPSRAGRPLLLIDLAVPRDVDPAVDEVAGVARLDLDHLQVNLDRGLAQRHAALPHAEAIIDEEMAALHRQLRELAHRPLIVDLRQQAESIRRNEVRRTLKHLGEVDPEVVQHIERLTHALVNKLLHDPTVWIRETAGNEAACVPEALVREMFGLSAVSNNDRAPTP